jgi:hypothetical protein
MRLAALLAQIDLSRQDPMVPDAGEVMGATGSTVVVAAQVPGL